MALDDFDAVYSAATEVNLQGEYLILSGDGRTVAVKPSLLSKVAMIEITDLHVDENKRMPRFFTSQTFRLEELAGLEIPPSFRKLLESGGARHGS